MPAIGLAVATLPFLALGVLLSGAVVATGMAACVMALAAALDRRLLAMSVWFGIATAFSAQALLAAPFFLAVAIRHRARLRDWLAAPAIWLGAMLPAMISGSRPGYPPHLDVGTPEAPTIGSIAALINPGYAPHLTGLLFAAAAAAAAMFIARMQVASFSRSEMIGIAGLAVLLTSGLLPGVQVHDFLLAAALTLASAIVRPTRHAIQVAGLVQFGFLATLCAHIGFGAPAVAIGATCVIIATCLAAWPLIAPHANDNRDGPRGIPPPYGLRGTLSFDMMNAPVARPRGE